jgi:hypothetical protein
METIDRVYFAESPRPILALAEREGIDLFVADVAELRRTRERRGVAHPLGLEQLVERCGVLRDGDLVAVPVACGGAPP